MRIESGGVSDVGLVRTNNEDCYRIVAPLNLFVLSDGMGGEAHGEVASSLAVETVVKYCVEAVDKPSLQMFGEAPATSSSKTRLLSSAIHLANKRVFESAQGHAEQHGMGATLTAAWIAEETLSVAHVGDSRVYLLRSGGLHQLTNDHSLVAEQVRRGVLTAVEAECSDMQSVLLRALGTQQEIEIEATEHPLFPRDILLLCSDGLTRMVTEPEIAGTLQAETDPAKAAERLVVLAKDNGGADNITVIVVRLEPQANGWLSWLRRGARKDAGANGSAGGNSDG